VVNDWYLTAYKPIVQNNEVVGIVYFGLPEKDLTSIRSFFNSKKYLDNGYPFLVSSEGEIIIHSEIQGESISKEPFFKELLSSNDKSGKIESEWRGEMQRMYFQYVKPIDAYVVAVVYEEDLMKSINQVRNAIIIAFTNDYKRIAPGCFVCEIHCAW
jgi:methyl-accepting chemotaxis protein